MDYNHLTLKAACKTVCNGSFCLIFHLLSFLGNDRCVNPLNNQKKTKRERGQTVCGRRRKSQSDKSEGKRNIKQWIYFKNKSWIKKTIFQDHKLS